jgi:hypothetical protein
MPVHELLLRLSRRLAEAESAESMMQLLTPAMERTIDRMPPEVLEKWTEAKADAGHRAEQIMEMKSILYWLAKTRS